MCYIVIGMCPCVVIEVKKSYETLIRNDKHHALPRELKINIKHRYGTTNITIICKIGMSKYHRNFNIILTIQICNIIIDTPT